MLATLLILIREMQEAMSKYVAAIYQGLMAYQSLLSSSIIAASGHHFRALAIINSSITADYRHSSARLWWSENISSAFAAWRRRLYWPVLAIESRRHLTSQQSYRLMGYYLKHFTFAVRRAAH